MLVRDLSNTNESHVGFVRVRAQGAGGVYLKSTEGTTSVDRFFVDSRKRSQAAGLKRGLPVHLECTRRQDSPAASTSLSFTRPDAPDTVRQL